MKIVIQRVSQASVDVRDETVAKIGSGLLVLLGIKKGDTKEEAEWLAEKLVGLRIFEDEDGKMNRSVQAVGGGLLIVPNFTLYADTSQGTRPGFGSAARPGPAETLFDYMVSHTMQLFDGSVQAGVFGADMDVSLVNDGPVTLVIER